MLFEGVLALQRAVLNVIGCHDTNAERIGVLVHRTCCIGYFSHCRVSRRRVLGDGVLDSQQGINGKNGLGITGREFADAAVSKGVEQCDGLRVVGRRIRRQLVVPKRQAFVEGGAVDACGCAVNAIERRRSLVLNGRDRVGYGGDIGAVGFFGIAYVQLVPHNMGVGKQLNGG